MLCEKLRALCGKKRIAQLLNIDETSAAKKGAAQKNQAFSLAAINYSKKL
jgi:hypothetical protein